MAQSQQQVLQSLGRGNWQVVGQRDELVTREVPTKNEFGDTVMVKQEVPSGNTIWVLSGPNGEPDEVTVKRITSSGGEESSPTGPQYDVVKGPSKTPAQPTGSSNDPKGTRKKQLIDMPDGSKASIEVVADGLGNWSPDTSVPPVPYIAAEGKTPPAPVSSTTLKQIPQLVDGKWTWTDNPNYVAPTTGEADRPPAPSVNTNAPQIPEWDGAKWVWKDNPNYKSPGGDQTPGQKAVDAAAASTAGGVAEANLKKAQADADRALIDLQNAQRAARQAPTDAQAQQAIATAQKGLDLANQRLEQELAQAKDLNPIAVQQAQATLDRSKQTIQQAQLGDLYGRPQQLQQIRDLIAAGEITPEEGSAMSAALNRGTTVYQAMQQQQSDRSTARTQDVSNRNQLASTFGSTFTSGLNTLAGMNTYATKGSTAGADAFVALLNMAQDRLNSYQLPPAQTPDYLGAGTPVGGMVNTAQQQIQPAAVPPTTGGGESGHQITINIGGSGSASNPQPPTPVLPAGVAGTANDPRNMAVSGYQGAPNPNTFGGGGNVGGLVSAAAKSVPATEQDIWDAYGVSPTQRRVGGPQFD